MDTILPFEIAGAVALARQKRASGSSSYRVRTGDADFPITELTSDGFVIEAEGRPPLRGYTDIFRGDERVVGGLVVCTWVRDGMIGYQFKRTTAGNPAPEDHVLPDLAEPERSRSDDGL